MHCTSLLFQPSFDCDSVSHSRAITFRSMNGWVGWMDGSKEGWMRDMVGGGGKWNYHR